MTSDPGTSSSQVMTTDCVSAHPGVASPSETLTVSVTGPGAVHVNVGLADVASLNVPDAADQWYASGAGPLSVSCATTATPAGKPTAMSAGFAETPSAIGQTLTTPLTSTLPVCGGSWQSSVTATVATAPAVTLKVPLPPQVDTPSVPVAVSMIVYPLPAGRPPMTAEIVLLAATLIVPVDEKLFGPLMV